MGSGEPHGFRLIVSVVAAVFSALLVLVPGGYLVLGAAAIPSCHENCSLGIETAVVVGGLVGASACALAALRIAVDRLRGRDGSLGTMLSWQALTVVLLVATAIVSLALGPK